MDKLLNSDEDASQLEIKTIIGASNNPTSNFRIQTLFLTMVSTPSVYNDLVIFINDAIQNATNDEKALAGTKFELISGESTLVYLYLYWSKLLPTSIDVNVLQYS